MKSTKISLREMAEKCSPEIKEEIRLSMGLSNLLDDFMHQKGISKNELAKSLGTRPCEVERWLSGQYNFSMSTIAVLSSYFGKPFIEIAK